MCKNLTILILVTCSTWALPSTGEAQTASKARIIVAKYNVNALRTIARNFEVKKTALRQEAFNAGFKVTFERGIAAADGAVGKPGIFAELQAVSSDGKPIYYRTFNAAAARSTRTNFLHPQGALGLDLTGENLTIYVWDGGTARLSHKEFGNRLTAGDSPTGYNGLGSDHATHVVGTLIAAGLDSEAKGMAFKAHAKSFDWNSDTSEATTAAASGMLISNHSYGFSARDDFGNPVLPSSYFGGYLDTSRDWDVVMHNAPHYLMVVAAGNDGDDDTANSKPLQGNAEFDKLSGHCISKNSLVVANAIDVSVSSSGEPLGLVQIVGSSSEGPTDDLRVKPDITGNGFELKSTLHMGNQGNTNDKYGQLGWTGTSMASPNVAGSLLLLQQLFDRENGRFMRAATLKGLALHTADETGTEGPDPIFGWGLMNAKRAAETIQENGESSVIYESTLISNSEFIGKFKAKGGVRVSISWTDPPGKAVQDTVVNSSTPVLINDLDLRLTKAGEVLQPWRLNSVNNNGRGDNKVDPFERIDDSDTSDTSIEYVISVKHKDNLAAGSQDFSLIVTGEDLAFELPEFASSSSSEQEGLSGIKADLKKVIGELDLILKRLEKSSPSVLQIDSSTDSDGAKKLWNMINGGEVVNLRNFELFEGMQQIQSQNLTEEQAERFQSVLEQMKLIELKSVGKPAYGHKPGIGTSEGAK